MYKTMIVLIIYKRPQLLLTLSQTSRCFYMSAIILQKSFQNIVREEEVAHN